jgi:hypothetical protein
MTVDPSLYDVLECDRRPTPWGEATYVRFHRRDMAPMGYRELWEVFATFLPGKWGIQSFPQRGHFLDQANKYHLLVFDTAPPGFDLFEKPPKGTRVVAEYLTASDTIDGRLKAH